MTHDDLVSEFFEAVNRRDTAKMEDFLLPDAELYFPKTQPLIGRQRILRFFKILFRQYPELIFDIHRVIRQGDRAAVHWTNRGLRRTGQPYRNEGVTILETEGGAIRFMSDFFKDTSLF